MTKVSVIVPIYNVENFLMRCLDSLVNQTLEEIEIILVNDASTDNSFIIMNEYKEKYDNKIKIINSNVNLRQGGARNLGLDIATGEFIGFVDSDDWVSLDMYELLYEKAKETGCDVVDGDYYVANDEEILNTVISNTDDQIGILDTQRKKGLILNSGRLWTKIYKRDLFTEHSIKFPEHLFYEDNPVVPLIMVHVNHLEKVSKPLYFYYHNTSSTTKKKNSYHQFDRLETSLILLDEFKERGLYETYKEEVEYRFSELYYIATVFVCLTFFNKPEISYLKKIRNYMKINMKKYRKNIYFHRIGLKAKSITKLNDINPYLLSYLFRIYQAVIKQ